MSSSKPVAVSSAQAQDGISTELRNNIYSALLSGTGIKNIEATLEHEMQASGWTANLKAYITHLLRSGECTTLDEVQEKVHEKIKQSSSGVKPNGVANGVNGTNGHSKDAEDHNLQIPDRAVREGVRVVRRELEKVCDITVEDDKTADSASESHERNSRRGDRKPILKINPPKPPTTTRGSPVKNTEKKGSPSIAREVLINQLNEPESTGIGVEAGSDSDIPLILRKPLKRPAPRLEFVNTTQDDYKEE